MARPSSTNVSGATFIVCAIASTPAGPAVEDSNNRHKILSILTIEPLRVDTRHVECGSRKFDFNISIGATRCVIADPPQVVVRDTRSTAAASGDFLGRFLVDFYSQFNRVASDDFREFLDFVKVQVLSDLKSISQRS